MTNAGSIVTSRDRHPEFLALHPPLGADAYAHRRGTRHAGQAPATRRCYQARQAPPGPYRCQGGAPSGWLGGPSAPTAAPIGPVSSGNTFRHAFYRVLTLPRKEGYDPVHLAVISFRTGRK